ncbi:MAG: ATP-dependent Clp protease adaptor ClpS [Pseudomonadota bacterium]|nr:ATP-dependent Clp protease adaptor ClpS [Pseudomonadota bacterium]
MLRYTAGPDKKDDDGGVRIAPDLDVKTRIEKPRMYKVLFHNDDYTTMEFVVEVLTVVFRRTRVESTRIMLSVHRTGKGVAGVYTREIAETKAQLAMDRARDRGYPLLVTTEPE